MGIFGYEARFSGSSTSGSVVQGMDGFGFSAGALARAQEAVLSAGSGTDVMRLLWCGGSPNENYGHALGQNERMRVRGNGNVNNIRHICAGTNVLTATLEW